ncbi:MAG: tRNA epoxyqueuosine(34) reductase QueG [Bacteroidota bacterium]
MDKRSEYSRQIKDKAFDLGFLFCGISHAAFLEEEAPRLEKWLGSGFQGKMSYMENHFDKRLDPRKLVDDAKSVVTVLYNYYTEDVPEDPDAIKISKYAYGEDYHKVIKDKLYAIFEFITEEIGQVSGRVFVDSAPVMDKAWARRSGAGWIGKNTNLIHPRNGSFFFIAEIILDLDLEADGPIRDYCGRCTRCIDACPTEAIVEPYVVDGSKCISYLTIELKDALLPNEFRGKLDNWAFGCDICQDVCPWNRFSKRHQEERFDPHPDLLNMKRSDWIELTEEVYAELFRNSAVNRTGFKGLMRNIDFLTNR